jgi:thioredoxin reductase (NADPH)
MSTLDCVIVGAGPAGLTAAIYLRRFHRAICVLSEGEARVERIGLSLNVPGFPDGISGHDLLARLRQQFARFEGTVTARRATAIEARPEGSFIVRAGDGNDDVWHTRTVLLATGGRDREARVPGIRAIKERGLLRECPICDGYEFSQQRIGVIGESEHGAKEALFLRHYSEQICLMSPGAQDRPAPEWQSPLAEHQVACRTSGIRQVTHGSDGLTVHLNDGEALRCDVLYSALGCHPASELGKALGAHCDPSGNLLVDGHCRTNVPGLYAAGDVTAGLDQIAVAMGQGATAATAIHNSL